jgi:hypothetical protein
MIDGHGRLIGDPPKRRGDEKVLVHLLAASDAARRAVIDDLTAPPAPVALAA